MAPDRSFRPNASAPLWKVSSKVMSGCGAVLFSTSGCPDRACSGEACSGKACSSEACPDGGSSSTMEIQMFRFLTNISDGLVYIA